MKKSTTVWTKFHDMHSGGGRKLEWESIYIEAPEGEFEVDSFRRVARVAYIPLAEYVKRPEVKVIPASEIRPEWRKGELRQEGFWSEVQS